MKTLTPQPISLAAIVAALALAATAIAQQPAPPAAEKSPAPAAGSQPAGAAADPKEKSPGNADPKKAGAKSPAAPQPQAAGQPAPNAAKPPAAKAAAPEPAQQKWTPAAAAAADRLPILLRPDPPVSDVNLPGTLQAAPRGIEQRTLRSLLGRKVRSSDDRTLGAVKDFLVRPQGGEVAYVVVFAGGLGVRDALHLAPLAALQPSRAHKGEYTVGMTEAQWKGLGALDSKVFDADYLAVTERDRRSLAERFGIALDDPAAAGTPEAEALSREFVRLDRIRGDDVFLDGLRIGRIEDVLIDERAGTTSALFSPSAHLAESKQKFLIPLNRYSLGVAKGDRITMTLTRADFDRMKQITHAGQETAPGPAAPTPVAAAPAPQGGNAPANAGATAKAPTAPSPPAAPPPPPSKPTVSTSPAAR